VALSGGLDSRALLACIENKEQTFAFCCYNEPNQEFRIAKAVAEALEISFQPLQRDFEYYGDNAEAGVRISGGMGTFANNHFLGMMPRLRAEGMQNLLTGCYCDYLFKGLTLNLRSHWLTGREELGAFQQQFYFSEYQSRTPLAFRARERMESRIPAELQNQESADKVFQIEARRTFPLFYEGDNQQRIVPQRVTGWSVPITDLDVLKVYRKIPYQYKLNRSVFMKAALMLCDTRLGTIADANTGARVGAPLLTRLVAAQYSRVKRRMRRLRRSIATEESWPDWKHYVAHSRKLRELWMRPNCDAFDLLERVVGSENLSRDVGAYGENRSLFVRLLTLKLWLDQRR
jgi:asparagine synthase (glutamine-hydrolysing)